MIKFVKSVKSLNVKLLNQLNVLWFLLIKLYYLLFMEHVYMRSEVNSNQFEISLRGKILLRCKVISLLAFTDNETDFGANFTSVNLTEVKFQSAVSFPRKQWMPAVK